jgi:hypothetical protein
MACIAVYLDSDHDVQLRVGHMREVKKLLLVVVFLAYVTYTTINYVAALSSIQVHNDLKILETVRYDNAWKFSWLTPAGTLCHSNANKNKSLPESIFTVTATFKCLTDTMLPIVLAML